ncbi:MAG: 4-hydroxy-tetrahydrodipicolinate reductase, partial [Hyphomicrobiales bacterium]|nr:4-hydroxy-tetrahydrodipicolinate reductase [Hyphomicrobiales bacterium]
GLDLGALAGTDRRGVLLAADALTLFAQCDAVIDFTNPKATAEFAGLAAQSKCVYIVGTTGLSADDLAFIGEQAHQTCIIRSGNMSLGVNLLAAMVQKVAAALDPSFDIEIVEMHHRMKIDAPSGTAYLLAEAAAAGRQIALEDHSIRSRDGETGQRPEGSIGFATLRGGTVVGDHSVIFAGNGERITLSHHAEDRSLFASGAVKAALWSKGRPVGLYSMMDVLGLS